MMENAHNINKNISRMMTAFIHCNFLIGPSTHGYYKSDFKSGRVQAKKYENEELELIHPDITSDYQPSDHAGTMRKF
jgi:hypothetical protein